MNDAADLIARLDKATATFDNTATKRLCSDATAFIKSTDEAFTEPQAKKLLKLLRRKRHFRLMECVADAFIQEGRDENVIRKLYAQALVDQGNVTAATAVLESLVVRAANDHVEFAEAHGLLGRAYKQLYVESPKPDSKRAREALSTSLSEYYSIYTDKRYKDDPAKLWHGVNAVALLCRAKRDGIPVPDSGYPEPEVIAREIIVAVKALEKAGYWDLASAGEASLALNDTDGMWEWYGKYLRSDDTDAFELASTHRQLVEVWQLNVDGGPGEFLLPLIRERLLRRQGGCLELTGRDLTHGKMQHVGRMELVLGTEWYKNMEWYDIGRERSRSVARIANQWKKGIGTGFLVRGRDLADRLGDDIFLVTNAHVITKDERWVRDKGALLPEQARITFEGLGGSTSSMKWSVGEFIWTSPPGELDVTVVKLNTAVPGTSPCPVRAIEPSVGSTSQAYVIGHPFGGELSVSLADNVVLGFRDPRIHYRSPTDGGHSGSPVFDNDWNLMGVHHMGFEQTRLNDTDEPYPANEGIWIKAVQRAIQKA